MKSKRIILMAAFISAVLLIGSLPATAMGGYGSIVLNSEATQAFEKGFTDPNLVYYHSGSDVWPDAIIGLNKAYELDSSLWHKCATQSVAKNHVSGMQVAASTLRLPLHGFAVLDDMGTKIGVWYSPLNTPTFVRRVSEKAVDIHTPRYEYRLNTILNGN